MQLFHIGYHKTGTTWFQKNFYPLLNNLEYISQGKVKSNFINQYRLAVLPEFPDNICMCDEELLGNIHLGSVGGAQAYSNIKRISEVSKQPRIVVFVRNQADLLYSCYLQYVKKGGSLTFSQYIGQDRMAANRLPVFDMEHFKFSRLYDFLVSVFGKDAVYLYFYEDFVHSPRQFLEGFSEDHELSLEKKPRTDVRSNRSYCRSQLGFMRLFNKLTCGNVYKHDNIVNLGAAVSALGKIVDPLLRLDDRKAEPKATLVSYIKDYYREDNILLSKEFDLPDSYFVR